MRQAYPSPNDTPQARALGENTTKSIKEGKSNEKSDETVGALASVQPTKSLRRSVFTSHELHADAPNIDFWGVIVFRRSPIARQRKPTASSWKPNLDMDWLTRARTKLDTTVDERTSKLGFGWECLLLYTKHRTHKFPKGRKNPDETARAAAARHLLDKTGMADDQWTLTGAVATGPPCDMYSNDAYFVGTMNQNCLYQPPIIGVQDCGSEWISVSNALRLLSLDQRRKNCLIDAAKRLQPI